MTDATPRRPPAAVPAADGALMMGSPHDVTTVTNRSMTDPLTRRGAPAKKAPARRPGQAGLSFRSNGAIERPHCRRRVYIRPSEFAEASS